MKKLILLLSILFVVSCSKDPIIYTLTTSASPAEGGVVSPASATFEEGQTATITASPSSDYLFQSWSGATGSTNSTSVVMNSDKTVTANFVKKKFALTISVEGEGTVTEKVIKAGAAHDTDYTIGSVIELTANPSDEWLFVEWKGDLTGTENPVEITVDKAKAVTAVFIKKQYPLTVEVEGEGTVAEKVIKAGASTDYNSGTVVELTATGKTGWEFKEWTGDLDSTENPAEITIDASKTVKAVFIKKQFAVNITIEGEGGGIVEREVLSGLDDGVDSKYEYGTELKLTAKPSSEWEFSSWKEDLEGTENPQTITIDTIKAVTAVFIKKQYPLTVEVEGEGTVAEKVIKAGAATDYNSGTIVELTASTDKEGWEFKEWSGDLTGNTNPIEITINAAKTVKAVFVKKPVAYLDDNSVTIKANSWAEVGDTVEIEGVTYTIVDLDTLKNMIAEEEDVTKVVTSLITDMSALFEDNRSFNQSIGSWDTSNVTIMNSMFKGTTKFDQDISNWNVSNVTTMANMFAFSWDSANSIAYETIFNKDLSNWDVSSVTNMFAMFSNNRVFNQNIGSWDTSNVTSMAQMFWRGNKFNQDISSWNVSKVTSMAQMLGDATEFNQDIGSWDVSNVTDMMEMFFNADAFNQDIGEWNVSNVVNIRYMFGNTNVFNGDIGSWNVSNVVDMRGMFSNADGFNQNIGSWDVSNVTQMDNLLWNADIFNQDLSKWCVSNISNEPTGFSDSSSLTDTNKPVWGKCPIDTSKVTVTWNSTSISSTTTNGVTTTRYGVSTQINNNWKLPIEVTKVAILLPNGGVAESAEFNGELSSGSARAMQWSFNTFQTATITWTYKYEDIEYDLVYSWELVSGSAIEESGDNSKLGVSTSKN
jgi:surface protein